MEFLILAVGVVLAVQAHVNRKAVLMGLREDLEAAKVQLSNEIGETQAAIAQVQTDLTELADRISTGTVTQADVDALRSAASALDSSQATLGEVSTGLDSLAVAPTDES